MMLALFGTVPVTSVPRDSWVGDPGSMSGGIVAWKTLRIRIHTGFQVAEDATVSVSI